MHDLEMAHMRSSGPIKAQQIRPIISHMEPGIEFGGTEKPFCLISLR
jgi:hypothetical protein